jgi:hypothetical protein
MATAQIAWVPNQVPGSMSVTGVSGDTTGKVSVADGRCPRCERGRHEVPCSGVDGEPVHLGN